MTVRSLTAKDIPQALALSHGAGWNQTRDDWQTLLALSPESCFALECEGELAATTTLVCYGRRLAWLGMVLTEPRFQRRGFASTLVETALQFAKDGGIETVQLDAASQGQPIYERFGFVAQHAVERWSSKGFESSAPSEGLARAQDAPDQLDREAFPADRRMLLSALARRSPPWRDGDDYVMRRSGSRAAYLGPCVARTKASARRLVGGVLSSEAGPWFWDLSPGNRDAFSLANEFGFKRERELVRMSWGAPFRGNESLIYAIAGFEFG